MVNKLSDLCLNGALFGTPFEEETNTCLGTCLLLCILETAMIHLFCYLGSVEYYFKVFQCYLTAGPKRFEYFECIQEIISLF